MEKLTIQEEEAMLAIWRLGGGFVREILEQIGDNAIPYTTLASTIRNLERKNFVKPVKYANAKRYQPVVAEEEYKAKFMNSFVGDYFKNSYKEMVSFFVQREKLSEDELKEIMDLIKKDNEV
ncbi:MAG: BlaI/MecI/CopY family transcriptional regulator [Sphingobacterium sp.]